MARRFKKTLRTALRIFWGSLLFAIIGVAVVVQLGRSIFPVLNDYRTLVEAQLSRQMQVQVSVGAIDAHWSGLRPQLHLFDVGIVNALGVPIFQVEKIDVDLNLLTTFRDWRLAFRRLRFSGLKVTLQQQESGSWNIRGLEKSSHQDSADAKNLSIDDPLDIFLFGRRVEMLDTTLNFQFRTGLASSLTMPSIRLENDADFHRLTARLSIDGGEQAMSLIVEGRGDPRDTDQFDAQGFLSLRAFPSEKVLAALGIGNDVLLDKMAGDAHPDWQNTGQVNLRLWFSGTSTQGMRWRGETNVTGVPVIPPKGMIWPEFFQAKFAGEWHPEAGWYVDLAEAKLDWPNFAAPALRARLRGQLGEPSQLLATDVDVGAWHQVIERAGLLPQAHDVLEQLAPFGHLRNLVVTQTTRDHGYFDLQANVEGGGVHPWAGVPGISGVNGYVQASAFAGHVIIDSDHGFSMEFPHVYKQPLNLKTAHGDVRWNVDLEQRTVGVSSGTLHVSNDDIAAVGHFNLRLPFVSSPGNEPELTLVIGAREGAATLHRLLVPYTIPERLYQWLDDGIKSGVVTNAGFIYHGSVLKDAKLARVIQLSAAVQHGELAFDKHWPPLKDASATIILDDSNFNVTHLQGQMLGVKIHNGEVALEHQPDDLGPAISLRGELDANGDEALNLLQHSPIKDILGPQLATWQLTGALTGKIDVLVPLQANAAAKARQNIDLHLVESRLRMPGLDLTFSGINGSFAYSSKTGLSSDSLNGKLWGQPVQAQIASQWGLDKSVQLEFTGKVDINQLQKWSRRPELRFASGTTDIKGSLTLPIGRDLPLHFGVLSSLQGVTIDLPQPFAKAETDDLEIQMDIDSFQATDNHPSYIDYAIRLDDHARLGMQSYDGELVGVGLALGGAHPELKRGQFNVSGRIEEADLPIWNDTLKRYVKFVADQDAADLVDAKVKETSGLPIKIALDLKQLHIGSLDFDDLQVKANHEQTQWLVDVQGKQLAGEIRIDKDRPLHVHLKQLWLPKRETNGVLKTSANDPAAAVTGLAKLDISKIDPLDFYCADVYIGDRSFGRWQFNLRPIIGGLMATNLRAKTLGAKITGLDPESKGAELVWLRSELGDTTYFAGRATAKDVGEVLTKLDEERMLTSSKASFDLNLQWHGAPDAIGLNKLVGFINMDLQRGRFIRGAQAGENPVVKLLGLLNFDTLARRLRLDFSDLNPEGLGYEQVRGRLAFKEGLIEVDSPLQVDSPASHIQFVGDINLVRQTVDAQLITTFPITGNLTMAAAVTGLLPAAVGVHLVGKLFKKQFDKVSSIRYRLKGTWAEPKMEVEKIFEDETDMSRERDKNGDKP